MTHPDYRRASYISINPNMKVGKPKKKKTKPQVSKSINKRLK